METKHGAAITCFHHTAGSGPAGAGRKAMFRGQGDPKFRRKIRALFPIPSPDQCIFVMSAAAGSRDFAGMEGKTILLGKGSFGAPLKRDSTQAVRSLERQVNLAEVRVVQCRSGLKNGQNDGL